MSIRDIYHKDSKALTGNDFEHTTRNNIMEDYDRRAREHIANNMNSVKKKEPYDPNNPFAEYM